jgi:hypothetical protein
MKSAPPDRAPALLILAAGMGSRYGGLKQIDPVGPSGETVLDYSIYDALNAGFGKVVFVIRRDFEVAFREKVGRRFETLVDIRNVFQELDRLPGGARNRERGAQRPPLFPRLVVSARDRAAASCRSPFRLVSLVPPWVRGTCAKWWPHPNRLSDKRSVRPRLYFIPNLSRSLWAPATG